MTVSLTTIFERDLNKLITELQSYQNESTLWQVTEGISNSGGNLALHICGNLQHFIGTILGNTDYVRQRDQEFELKNIPVSNLIEEIEITKNVIKDILGQLDTSQTMADYPVDVFKKAMTTEFFLLHLSAHLSYHLGQINYHRRMLDK
jgi:uncharacterized damage-inducible protein DinB